MYFREILTHDIYISIYLSGIMRDMIMMDYSGLIWEFCIKVHFSLKPSNVSIHSNHHEMILVTQVLFTFEFLSQREIR